MTAPGATPPETRDWTIVLTDGCAECGYQPTDPADSAERLDHAADLWAEVLARPGVATRPAPLVWSPLEYANHARDMVRLLGVRAASMLDEDLPTFADWDGDEAAVAHEYWRADPAVTAQDIRARTDETAAVLKRVADGAPATWARVGRRSDGVEFTVATLCQYLVHDVEHHLYDAGTPVR